MTYWEIISIVLNALLGGGFIVTLVTLRATRRKANAEAESQQIANASALLSEYVKNIVEPLKKEVNALRANIRSLTKAINRIQDCPHAGDCPVRGELQKQADTDADADRQA